MFGLMVEGQLARKRTRWMTSCLAIAEELEVPCDGSHEHIHLIGGRAKQTEKYSPRLVAAILRGLRRHLVGTGFIGALEVGPTVEESELVVEWPVEPAVGPESSRPVCDEYTNLELPAAGVNAARREEVDYLAKL